MCGEYGLCGGVDVVCVCCVDVDGVDVGMFCGDGCEVIFLMVVDDYGVVVIV